MGAGLNLFFAKNHSPSSPRIAPRPRPPNAPAPPREARKHPDTQCERCRGKPSFSAERLEEGQRRRLVSRAGARRSLNGGGVDFLFGGGGGHRGTQKGCTGYSTHTGVRMCTHRGTQMYKGVRGVHGGTHGCTGEHRGTQAYTWVHKGYTRVHKGYTRGTVRRAGVLYTGVQYCTQGYYTQGYTGVHRGTQGYTGVHGGVHTQGCSEAHRQKPLFC
jgi:hypothetical protein